MCRPHKYLDYSHRSTEVSRRMLKTPFRVELRDLQVCSILFSHAFAINSFVHVKKIALAVFGTEVA